MTRGESFDKARSICRQHGKFKLKKQFFVSTRRRLSNENNCPSGGDLLHDFRGATQDYIHAELDRRKVDLKTQLVWVGAQKEPGITARTWKWVNGN